MILQEFSYKQYENDPARYWEINKFKLNDINLIVGINASGKSRMLNVINGFSNLLLAPKIPFDEGTYDACFVNSNSEISYKIEIQQGVVIREEMTKDKTILITRDKNGSGEIFNADIKRNMKFKIPNNELIVFRRDEIQFPYLQDLYNWASNTRHFRFSKEEEKNTLAISESTLNPSENPPIRSLDRVLDVFRIANAIHKNNFTDILINDFNSIGYNISKVDTGALHSIKLKGPLGNKAFGLRVQEVDRKGYTDQSEMSDGMFRALSILIFYNYYLLESQKLNVLIDDIGEGLDYEKSSNLIKLLIEKSNEAGFTLIMTTNDKFVMNNTSLEYWQVIARTGGTVKLYNKFNSEKIFNDFKYTGLNNFDFFSTDFFTTGLQ